MRMSYCPPRDGAGETCDKTGGAGRGGVAGAVAMDRAGWVGAGRSGDRESAGRALGRAGPAGGRGRIGAGRAA